MAGFIFSSAFAYLERNDFSHSPRLCRQEHGEENQRLHLQQRRGEVEGGKGTCSPAQPQRQCSRQDLIRATQPPGTKGDLCACIKER